MVTAGRNWCVLTVFTVSSALAGPANVSQAAWARDSGFEQDAGRGRFSWRHRGLEVELIPGGRLIFHLASASTFRILFEGANSRSTPEGELPSSSVIYRYRGAAQDWRTGHLWNRVRYKELYPGIDLVLFETDSQLEYNFEVRPQADPKSIRIRYAGAVVHLNPHGDLDIRGSGNPVQQKIPFAYQAGDWGKRRVDCRYHFDHGVATLVLARYDRDRFLVIDPVLNFSTYLGGTSFDSVFAAASDSSGNLYLAGETSSGNLPNGALPFRSNRDAWVGKLNSAGTQFLYVVYLGGNGYDSARGIAVDTSGNAYVTGVTASSNFPTTAGAYSTHNSGTQQAFAVKLGSSGQINYATYLGGSGLDAGFAIAVDSTGAAYVAGQASSGNFPVTPGVFQSSLHGGVSDCFVSKLNPAGSALSYSTYLGGNSLDLCAGIAVDSAGDAYVTGTTSSTNFPLQAPLQNGFPGSFAAFVTEINPTGSAAIYSTLLGGSSADSGSAIAVDATGAAYVAGSAGSSDFPTTAGALQTTLNGVRNAFVTKLAPGGASLLYSTFLGGSASDSASAIAVDSLGQAVVAGSTSSANFPVSNAIQSAFGGYFDAFGAVLNAAGTGLVFSSYFGGAGDDHALAAAALPGSHLFLAGMTASDNFPPASALQGSLAGNYDGFGLNTTYGVASAGEVFIPLTPCRVSDTRSGSGFTGAFGPPSLVAGATRNFPIPSSVCNVPVSAEAYSMNITVVPPGPLGYLTVWPAGSSVPVVATLNSLAGAVVANAAIVVAGQSGAISVFATNNTDAVMDINGYFGPSGAPQGLQFYPLTPCRVADTRTGSGFTGAFGAPSLAGGATRNFPVQQSSCGIPVAAQAYSMRMTVVAPGPLGFLSTWPAGQPQPVVATLNALSGGVIGNQAIVPAGSAGAIAVFASNNTDLVIDINGYFAPPGTGGLYFYPLTPCRVADTRTGSGFSGAFGPPSLVGGATRNFPMPSSACGIAATAKAYSLNVTVVAPGPLGFLTAWPAGQPLPVAATVNALSGGVVGSAAIVPGGTSGAVSIFAANNTDVVIDINGYFGP